MVNVWAVFKHVSANVSIGHAEMHNLQQFIEMMTRVETTARCEIRDSQGWPSQQELQDPQALIPLYGEEVSYLTGG